MNIVNEITDALTKYLPEMTAKSMRDYLDMCEKDKTRLSAFVTANAKLEATISELNEKNEKLIRENNEIKTRYYDLEQRERVLELAKKELLAKEYRMDLTLKELEVRFLKENNNDIFKLVDKAFGHPSFSFVRTSENDIPYQRQDGYASSTLVRSNEHIQQEVKKI